jgi:hypothetical protein
VNLLLYIQALNQNEFKYNNPTLNQIKEEFHSYTVLDVDNLSQGDLLQYCAQAINESEKTVIVFQGDPTADISNLGIIIRSLRSLKDLSICTLNEHPVWNSYTKMIKGVFYQDLTSLIQGINPT